jgi:hypothetical protein
VELHLMHQVPGVQKHRLVLTSSFSARLHVSYEQQPGHML